MYNDNTTTYITEVLCACTVASKRCELAFIVTGTNTNTNTGFTSVRSTKRFGKPHPRLGRGVHIFQRGSLYFWNIWTRGSTYYGGPNITWQTTPKFSHYTKCTFPGLCTGLHGHMIVHLNEQICLNVEKMYGLTVTSSNPMWTSINLWKQN